MTDQSDSSLRGWWRRQGRWKWLVLGVLIILVVGVASGSHGKNKPSVTEPAAVQSIVPSMTSQNEAFWERLTTGQKTELAEDCRSKLASHAPGWPEAPPPHVRSIAPAQIISYIDKLYSEEPESYANIQRACENGASSIEMRTEERRREKVGNEEEHHEEHNKHLIASVSNGTFEATDSNVRAYMKAALIGESVRSVACSQGTCEVSFNDYNPVKLGILGKVLHVEGTPLSELTESVTKIFKALFSDRRLQQARVTSWIDVETVGGKLRKWPALRVMCGRSAAEQINWERVTPDGLKQLCDVSIFPDGSP
jgi:hypothetical protein